MISSLSSPATVTVYDGKVNLRVGNSKDVISIVIDNKLLAESFLQQFNLLWNQETSITKGVAAMEQTLLNLIDEIRIGDTYDVLGAGFGIKGYEQKYVGIFTKVHEKRIQKGITARMLFQQGTEGIVEKYKVTLYKNTVIKFLPYAMESPVGIFPYKDKTILTIQEEEPTIITINNTEITKSFLRHFEALWNQDVRIFKGLDAVKTIFEEMLEYREADLIGARGYYIDLAPPGYIDDWEKRVIRAGFTMRNIVDPTVRGHRITTFSFAQTKYTLPKEFSKLSVFWIYGNKIVITNWMETEPIVIVIENKNLHDTYKHQFELLWNQKMVSFEGEPGVRAVFDDMLNYKEVWFIGGNDGIKKYFPQYWKEHDKERIKKKVFWHDLIDAKLMSNLFPGKERRTVSYYEYKVLPPELSSPHVIAFYGNKVANIIWREKTLITIIEDKEIMEGYKKYFEYLWKTIP